MRIIVSEYRLCLHLQREESRRHIFSFRDAAGAIAAATNPAAAGLY